MSKVIPFVSGIRFDYKGKWLDIYGELNKAWKNLYYDELEQFTYLYRRGVADPFCRFTSTELYVYNIPNLDLINDLLKCSKVNRKIKLIYTVE